MLGIIPGTNVQIDFAKWQLITAVFAVLGLMGYACKQRLPSNVLWYVSVRRSVHNSKVAFKKTSWA